MRGAAISRRMGFREVGTQAIGGGKRVSLQAKTIAAPSA
jgi:hypothetical protein